MEIINCTNCGLANSSSLKYCSGCGNKLPKIKEKHTSENLTNSQTRNKFNKKKSLGVLVGSIVFFISYFAVQQIFFKPPSFDKILIQTANELNKTAPFMVDSDTRFDNAITFPDKIFQYNYTLINLTKAEVKLDTVKKYLDPEIINDVKTNPDMKTLRDYKVTFQYYYKDRNGVFVHKITVTPEMYK